MIVPFCRRRSTPTVGKNLQGQRRPANGFRDRLVKFVAGKIEERVRRFQFGNDDRIVDAAKAFDRSREGIA